MVRLTKAAIVLTGIAITGLCASPAPAAKGIKKHQEHHIRGTIVSVHHGKQGTPGSVTIHVTHHKHKKGTTAIVHKGANHTLTVDRHTHVHNAANLPVGHMALHKGEHVTVATHNGHADQIRIHHHRKRVARL
jgi:hypothetical protein